MLQLMSSEKALQRKTENRITAGCLESNGKKGAGIAARAVAWQWQQKEGKETCGEFRVREQSGTERMHLSWEDPSVVPPNSREAKAKSERAFF